MPKSQKCLESEIFVVKEKVEFGHQSKSVPNVEVTTVYLVSRLIFSFIEN